MTILFSIFLKPMMKIRQDALMSSLKTTAFHRKNRGLVTICGRDVRLRVKLRPWGKKPGSSRPITDHDTACVTYRCFLPDLTRFVTVCCVATGRMIQAIGPGILEGLFAAAAGSAHGRHEGPAEHRESSILELFIFSSPKFGCHSDPPMFRVDLE
jgi:hypothetical protein